jgi:2'-5' RNA ligase
MPAPSDTAAGDARLFVAVPLTDATRGALGAALQRATGPGGLPGRVVPSANWHLTLRFLGSTTRAAGFRLAECLGHAVVDIAFDVAFSGLGAFPKPGRARTLWVGIASSGAELARLAAVVEACAQDAGFAADERPFQAHLTLSRLDPPADVGPLVAGAPPFRVVQRCDRIVLYESHLGAGPARYEALATVALGEGDP